MLDATSFNRFADDLPEVISSLFQAHIQTSDLDLLRILSDQGVLSLSEELDVETLLHQRPTHPSVGPSQSHVQSQLETFYAFAVLKQVVRALQLWSDQAADSLLEKNAAAIHMSMEQAAGYLGKISTLSLRVEALENIYSLLFVEFAENGDADAAVGHVSYQVRSSFTTPICFLKSILSGCR